MALPEMVSSHEARNYKKRKRSEISLLLPLVPACKFYLELATEDANLSAGNIRMNAILCSGLASSQS